MRLQNVREEAVIAVPLANVVERDDEQISVFERLEHCFAVVPLRHGITQRAVQSFQDGRRQQERPYVIGLTLQHLVDQVVDDVPVVAREAGDEPPDVRSSLH